MQIDPFPYEKQMQMLDTCPTSSVRLCLEKELDRKEVPQFVSLLILFHAFYITNGSPVQGFYVSLAAGLTNVMLDYVFLAHFGMGIFGAGLATDISDFVAAAIGIWYFPTHGRTLRFSPFTFALHPLLPSFGNGSSEMVTQLSVGITTLLFNQVTYSCAGENGIAAISIILYAEMLLSSFFMGFVTSAWKSRQSLPCKIGKSRLASIHKTAFHQTAFPVFYFPLWISQMSRMLKMNAIR